MNHLILKNIIMIKEIKLIRMNKKIIEILMNKIKMVEHISQAKMKNKFIHIKNLKKIVKTIKILRII